MKIVADFTLLPLGVGASLSRYVAACRSIVEESGLTFSMHSAGTTIEGEWDEVDAVIRRCTERMHELGAPRVAASIRVDSRRDKEPTIAGKLESLDNAITSIDKQN